MVSAVLIGLVSTIVLSSLATPASAARVKTITSADASIVEGDAGSKTMTIKVTWNGAKGGGAVSVSYATADVTATAGADYTAKSGSLSLSGGGCRCGTISVRSSAMA